MNRFKIHCLSKCKSTVFLILYVVSVVSSQKNSDNLMSFASAEIVVDVLPGNDIFYMHPISKGISIYNLAEVFQVKADKIYAVNKLNPTQPINDGRIVKIPFQRKMVITDRTKFVKNNIYIPLFYIVKKGDTSFRLCKQYFELDPKIFLTLNNKKDGNIQSGEKLLIGWVLLPSKIKNSYIVQKKVPDVQNLPNELKNKEITSVKTDTLLQVNKKIPVVKYYESEVIGWWDKSIKLQSGYFALHNDARPGSNIDIYNPMMKSHVKAKVIGKIPSDTYYSDVQIILSPGAVMDLGILDTRYMVNIKFEK